MDPGHPLVFFYRNFVNFAKSISEQLFFFRLFPSRVATAESPFASVNQLHLPSLLTSACPPSPQPNTSSLVFPVFSFWQLQHLSAFIVLIQMLHMAIPSQSWLSELPSKPDHFQCNLWTIPLRNSSDAICSYNQTPQSMFLMSMTLSPHAANVTRQTQIMLALVLGNQHTSESKWEKATKVMADMAASLLVCIEPSNVTWPRRINIWSDGVSKTLAKACPQIQSKTLKCNF